jgi:hypothetical protein
MTPRDETRPRDRVCGILNVAFCIAIASSCAVPKPIVLPSDSGSPLADFAAVHATLASACTGVRTLTAELGLSGRVGDERLRARVVAGFERPSSMHLEGVAPFGQPVFILAARNGTATLLLPGDKRILRGSAPEAILEALVGVTLAPADLLAVFTGCVVPTPRAIAGRIHQGGLASIDVESGDQQGGPRSATLYLQRAGSVWQLRAARRDKWQIEYVQGSGTFPESVRLVSPEQRVNLGASLSQVETNVDIDAAAFAVEERKDLTPLTIEELRDAGPLRGQ